VVPLVRAADAAGVRAPHGTRRVRDGHPQGGDAKGGSVSGQQPRVGPGPPSTTGVTLSQAREHDVLGCWIRRYDQNVWFVVHRLAHAAVIAS